MKKLLTSFSIFALVVIFSACDNNDKANEDKPIVNYVAPTNNQTFLLGDTLKVQAEIKADAGINQIKVDIHYGENHSHDAATISLSNASNPTNAWQEGTIITDAIGKLSYQLDIAYIIPDTIATGHYHVGILITDKQNREVKEYRTVEID